MGTPETIAEAALVRALGDYRVRRYVEQSPAHAVEMARDAIMEATALLIERADRRRRSVRRHRSR
jgi:hypothetical protein